MATTATETLNILAAEHAAELANVRREYGALPLAATARLMARTGMHHAEEAYREEARQRCLRNRWAAMTRRADAA